MIYYTSQKKEKERKRGTEEEKMRGREKRNQDTPKKKSSFVPWDCSKIGTSWGSGSKEVHGKLAMRDKDKDKGPSIHAGSASFAHFMFKRTLFFLLSV